MRHKYILSNLSLKRKLFKISRLTFVDLTDFSESGRPGVRNKTILRIKSHLVLYFKRKKEKYMELCLTPLRNKMILRKKQKSILNFDI